MTARAHFDAHERATLAAAMARIIPSADGPGASEAGTIDFLEGYLFEERIYARADGRGFQPLPERVAEAWRLRLDAIRAQYAEGVKQLDERARVAYGREFRELDGPLQDRVLAALEHELAADETPGLQEPATEEGLGFFALLVLHTRQGFYADPVYGGNHDRVGWDHIGFPGPSSLAEVHSGRYSTLDYFADGPA
jgi:gluconate 2-dehydrogenase gamma chain